MEEAVEKAREKAEGFLFKEVAKISEDIQKEKKSILYPSRTWESLILRLESYSYLGHKNKELKSKYAEELKSLWVHWRKAQKKYKRKSHGIFYPVEREGVFLFERNIAMLRAKEIFGIPGFQEDFDFVIEKFKDELLGPIGYLFVCYRDYWIIFRSLTVQDTLKEQIQNSASMVLEEIKNHDLIRYKNRNRRIGEYATWINCVISLIISKLGGDYFNSAKCAIDKFIYYQQKNGSILNEIIITCSFAIAIYLAKIDPLKIIQPKILKWLLSKQNKNGSWDHWWFEDLDFFNRNYLIPGWRVLSTVIVLETIDLITNNEPLPSWVPKEKPISYPEEKKVLIHVDSPFPIPQGASWGDVYFRFIDNEEVQIQVLDKSYGVKKFVALNFRDGRKRKEDIPNKLWSKTLLALARTKGDLPMSDNVLPEKDRVNLRKNISRLQDKLKELFGILENPIHPYKKYNSYRTKFNISFLERNDELERNREVQEVFNDNIKKMERQQRKKITYESLKEVKDIKKEK